MSESPALPGAAAGRTTFARVVEEGFYGGLIGAVTVGLLFLIHDLLTEKLFYTPALLGSLIFRGAPPADPATVDLPMAIAYNGLHLVVFILGGVVASFAVHEVDQHPLLWYLLASGFVGLVFAGFLADAALGVPVLGRYHFWGGGVVAALAMALYFWRRHPDLARHLKEAWRKEAAES